MEAREISSPHMGTGFLVVQVTTANSAIPLEGAQVTVLEDGTDATDVLFELKSDAGGRTPRVALPAPLRALSESPGNQKPFATYNIEVVLSGFEKAIYAHVPIFDGITAMQQADLIPVPDNQYPDSFTQNRPEIFENTPPVL